MAFLRWKAFRTACAAEIPFELNFWEAALREKPRTGNLEVSEVNMEDLDFLPWIRWWRLER